MTRALVLATLALLAGAPRADFRLEERLPATSLVFAEIPSAAAFREGFKKTRLYSFFKDEEIRAFAGETLDAALRNIENLTADFEKETGVAVDRAWELPGGQVAFALPAVPELGAVPDALLTADCPGKRDVLLKIAAFARKSHDARSKDKAQTYKIGDVDVLTGAFVTDVVWHLAVFGDVLAVGTTRAALEHLAGPAPAAPLAKSADFLKAREKSGAKELFFFADIAGFLRQATPKLAEHEKKLFGALGLDGFTYAAGGLAFGDGKVVERFFLGTGAQRRGLAKFLSLKGAAPGFETAPADAIHFVSLSIDLAELFDTVLEIAAQADPPAALRLKDQLADLEKQAGVTLKGDLFPALGHAVSAYAALPGDGLLPEAVTTFQIRDAARFDACLQAALRNIPAKLGAIEFKGRKIEYFNFEGPSGFDPTRMLLSNLYWMRDGDRLHVSGLVSLAWGFGSANSLKRHVLRREKPTLAAAPSIKDWVGGKTDDASLVFYLDLERGFTAFYNTVAPITLFFRDGLHQSGAGVDLMKLPLGETVGKYLSQVVHRVKVEPDGLRVEGVSASGASLMTIVYAGAAVAAVFPAVARAEENAKTSACLAQQSGVYFALTQHQVDKNALPKQTGADFLKALKDGGYLDDVPVCPHAGLPAYRGPAKDVNTMDDLDVFFCDEPGNHPDGSINVVRKNGAMEALRQDHPDYAKALKTTKSIK
ncbi:MAG TPA: hypothetical protein VF950_29630 [Planctomycetota bacterium]